MNKKSYTIDNLSSFYCFLIKETNETKKVIKSHIQSITYQILFFFQQKK